MKNPEHCTPISQNKTDTHKNDISALFSISRNPKYMLTFASYSSIMGKTFFFW